MSEKKCGSQGRILFRGGFAGGAHDRAANCDLPAGHSGDHTMNGQPFMVYDDQLTPEEDAAVNAEIQQLADLSDFDVMKRVNSKLGVSLSEKNVAARRARLALKPAQ